MKVAVLGYGVEGKSAVAYWFGRHFDVTVCDMNPDLELPLGVAGQLGPEYLNNLFVFDLIVRSPAIRPDAITTANPGTPDILDKVTSTIREFMEKCPAPVIGVTGTKGKGTTSTLITRMLEAAGKTVWLGGNIGKVPLDFLGQVQPGHVVVLELSSFQLMDITKAPHIAVCLMISPDHLNWHTDMAEYVSAKGQIFAHQTADDTAIFYAKSPEATQIAQLSPGSKLPYFDPSGAWVNGDTIQMGDVPICKTSEVGLIGPHNLQNICAALAAAWQIAPEPEALAKAIREFTGLEHRLQFVAEVGGVKYYDDSFSVQPEAAVAAIASFDAPKVIVLGGSDKGSPYDHLASAVRAANIRKAILIGDTAKAIATALEKVGFTNFEFGPTTMTQIVSVAAGHAQPGDMVLLSPGCASFGLFKDYKDRGNQFTVAVNAIGAQA